MTLHYKDKRLRLDNNYNYCIPPEKIMYINKEDSSIYSIFFERKFANHIRIVEKLVLTKLWSDYLNINHDLPNLEKLTLKKCSFFNYVSIVSRFEKLKSLKIKNCYFSNIRISNTNSEMFNIEELHIINTNVENIYLSINYPNLKSLTVNKTLIENIDIYYENLVQIALNNNELNRVNFNVELKNLIHLDLSYNKIKVLHLKNLPNLKNLIVNNNRLESFNCGDLPSLIFCNLSFNNLNDIDIDVLYNATNINLSYNRRLTNITFNRQFNNLMKLDVSNCNLSKLDLLDNPKLETLNIQENNLKEFNPPYMCNLRKSYLSRNKFITVHDNLITDKIEFISINDSYKFSESSINKLISLNTNIFNGLIVKESNNYNFNKC